MYLYIMPESDVAPLRDIFGAGSMNNHVNTQLWVQGAAQFIPRMNALLAHTQSLFKIVDMSTFTNPAQDVLGSILMENKSDKSTTHNYNILYSYILGTLGRKNPLNLLEVGMGTNNPDLVSSMGADGRPGASLYSFRDYLPNAQIHGADVDRDILFQADRIKTSYVDQMNLQTFKDMNVTFGNVKFDLIIDDGLHSIGANVNTLLYALDQVADGGWIVIEDIHIPDNWRTIDCILGKDKRYETFMVKAGNGYHYQSTSFMYVVHKLA